MFNFCDKNLKFLLKNLSINFPCTKKLIKRPSFQNLQVNNNYFFSIRQRAPVFFAKKLDISTQKPKKFRFYYPYLFELGMKVYLIE